MPFKNSSYADIILGTEKLLGACNSNPEVLPQVQDLHDQLSQLLSRIRETTVQQQNLTAERQKATQSLRALVNETVELHFLLRTRIKGVFGPRTEKLVEFQMSPLRPSRRKKLTEPPPPPPPPPASPPE